VWPRRVYYDGTLRRALCTIPKENSDALRHRALSNCSCLAGPLGAETLTRRLRSLPYALPSDGFFCLVLRSRSLSRDRCSCPPWGAILVHSPYSFISYRQHGTVRWHSCVLVGFWCHRGDGRSTSPS